MSTPSMSADGLARVDPAEAAGIGRAEGEATLALLRELGPDDWARPTDCTEWDVRTMVSHLVAQCEDGLRLGTLLRREVSGRLRYRGRAGVDAHMAAQVREHRDDAGPDLVERFATLWPRAVQTRATRPGFLRELRIDLGIPGVPRVPFRYLLDIVYNRDLWMHRVDLSRAAGRPFVIGDHDRHIVAQAMTDLAHQWSAAPVVLELTGPAGGTHRLGAGEPAATVRADAVGYLRALAGRDDGVALELVAGDADLLTLVRRARVPF